MTTITLGDIRSHHPCADGWATLTKALGTTDPTAELSIGDIVIANGLDNALWALRCLPPREAVAAVMPAVKRASVHTADLRVHECIAVVDRWIAGDDSVDLKGVARAAAAACAEAWAEAAACAAAEAACAEAEARAAACAAARDAARAAACAAACAEAEAWAEAWARAAAKAAEAAWAVARAAVCAAARAAWAAWEAARAAERDMQASDLLVMFPPIRLKAEVAA
jgi:hypothetical protein